MLCTQVEDAMNVTKRIGFGLIIETALGMQNVNEIASYNRRLESLHFGVADYAASTKAKTTVIGGPNPIITFLLILTVTTQERSIGEICGITQYQKW